MIGLSDAYDTGSGSGLDSLLLLGANKLNA
jgi:hypothetical protein